MMNKEGLRNTVMEMVKAAQEHGEFDLAIDSITYEVIYPEMPEVLVSLTIGGMIRNMIEDDEETLQ